MLGSIPSGPTKPSKLDGFFYFYPMNSFFVYVLFSQSLDRFYIGLTTLSVEERLENHLAKKNMMPKTSLKKQMTGL
ncbi:hypothetical protein D0X99_17350 [Algoriphagus lacus]|uniref:GIY-YIG domain-containing protein n=2 Tax=Algoriphagus lacus TaxID=2056311 RepID=A0A418PN60_9BACT|nr:hypothetical protein D0X99_17350 [Algoriphagus lacus]